MQCGWATPALTGVAPGIPTNRVISINEGDFTEARLKGSYNRDEPDAQARRRRVGTLHTTVLKAPSNPARPSCYDGVTFFMPVPAF